MPHRNCGAYLRSHPLVPVTKKTIVEPQRFEQELERVRERGYAYDEGEFAARLCCTGAPCCGMGARWRHSGSPSRPSALPPSARR